ncbi:MAG TPA: hypothetical protein VGO47_14015 [Chlamydiales bacterium]|nr:hypothetical protein [Chlamydiales bacterium]
MVDICPKFEGYSFSLPRKTCLELYILLVPNGNDTQQEDRHATVAAEKNILNQRYIESYQKFHVLTFLDAAWPCTKQASQKHLPPVFLFVQLSGSSPYNNNTHGSSTSSYIHILATIWHIIIRSMARGHHHYGCSFVRAHRLSVWVITNTNTLYTSLQFFFEFYLIIGSGASANLDLPDGHRVRVGAQRFCIPSTPWTTTTATLPPPRREELEFTKQCLFGTRWWE